MVEVQYRFRDDEPVADPAVTVDAFGEQTNAAAVRLDPNYAEAHLNLGQALALSPGRTKEAMDHFRAGVRLNPDSARGQLGLARLLLQSGGSRAEARACLEAAARLEPSWAEPRELLQDARLFQSRPER